MKDTLDALFRLVTIVPDILMATPVTGRPPYAGRQR